MEREARGSELFLHKNNIAVGKGRILWAPSATCTSGIHYPEGYVLPGGLRTRDEERAKAAAAAINELSGAAS